MRIVRTEFPLIAIALLAATTMAAQDPQKVNAAAGSAAASSASPAAQTPNPPPPAPPPPSDGRMRVFIAPMQNGLDGFITAEIVKQRLPMAIVTDDSTAEVVMSGASEKADDHWYNTVFGGKDKNEGNVRLLNIKTKELVWAGEAGDRSLWFGGLKRGGQRKVAERIVAQMKKDLFKGR